MSIKNIGIVGLAGRMGQLIYKELSRQPMYRVQGGFDKVSPKNGSLCSSLCEVLCHNDYIIDFSSPQLTEKLIQAALNNPKPLIIGTTSLGDINVAPLAEKVPVVVSSNTNVAAYLQRYLACQLASMLGEDYDIDISEKHHRYKSDNISGTALDLASSVASAKNIILADEESNYSWGEVRSPRSPHKIHMTAHRAGNFPGTHEISFTSDDETISITHTVFNRAIFAKGVLKILDWLILSRPPKGLYNMDDVFQHIDFKKTL
jgi:4-hydroxy-tetrahydrodipicolinate reductase